MGKIIMKEGERIEAKEGEEWIGKLHCFLTLLDVHKYMYSFVLQLSICSTFVCMQEQKAKR